MTVKELIEHLEKYPEFCVVKLVTEAYSQENYYHLDHISCAGEGMSGHVYLHGDGDPT